MFQEEIDDYLGSYQDVVYRRENPWACPQCGLRFKWDTQLLRHERQTGHHNQNREERRKKKFAKKPSKRCGLCKKQFATQLDRLSHYPWCEGKAQNKLARYRSSCPQHNYECTKHEQTQYFSTAQELLSHIRTHRSAKLPQKASSTTSQTPKASRRRANLSQRHRESLRRELKKVKILCAGKAEQLQMRFGVSVACIRKYFHTMKKERVISEGQLEEKQTINDNQC